MSTLFYFIWISLLMSTLLVFTYKRAVKVKFPTELYFQITGILLFAIPLGARFFHVFYEEPDYYWENPVAILYFWQGGFVYYGGLIGSLFTVLLFFQLHKTDRSFWQTADFFTPSLILGTGLGRVACFVQGCCYGGNWPFPYPAIERHPTQLYLLFWEILLYFTLVHKPKIPVTQSGVLFGSWIFLSALGRFLIEYLRMDFRGAMILGFSVSQVVALALMTVSGLFLIWKFRKGPQNLII